MTWFKRISVRWAILGLAVVGIGVYLVAPYFGWGFVLPWMQVPNLLYQDESTEVLARFEWSDSITVEEVEFAHLTLDLNYHDSWVISDEERQLLDSDIPLMVTLRPWSWEQNSYIDNPLNDVAGGAYDALFETFAAALPRRGADVFVRFAPDVEVPAGQYPWQQYPRIFIESFTRLAEICARLAPEAQMIWSAAGYPGAMEFYPGDAFLDAASVTYRYAAEKNLTAYPNDLPPDTDLYRRLHRLRFLRVPVYVVTEDRYRGELPDFSAVARKLRSGPEGTYGRPPVSDLNGPKTAHRKQAFVFGLYDPFDRLLDAPPVDVEHLFTDFDDIRDGRLDSVFQAAQDRGHATIVSFEPFYKPIETSDRDVLNKVSQGQHDEELLRLFDILRTAKQPVWLRYAHEMEIPIERYPWQSQDPQDYIASFRYVMGHDSLPPAVRRVWGPAGDRGSLEWYPGDDFVDLISIAIYGLPDKNITDPEQQESFEKIFKRKMWRMRHVDKPVFITEFGVKGPEEYQTRWMEAAAQVLREDPRIVGINYFNMSDTPKAWGEIKPPDWSISRATMDRFVELLESK